MWHVTFQTKTRADASPFLFPCLLSSGPVGMVTRWSRSTLLSHLLGESLMGMSAKPHQTLSEYEINSLCVKLLIFNMLYIAYGSVQFSSVPSVVSNSLWPHELQHTRPPCPSATPGVHSDSRLSSQWCHPAISSSVVSFSSCPQSLPASESFPISQLFAWGGQSTGVSALASFLPKNTQEWSPLGWTGWISLQSKGLSTVFSNTTVQKHQLFGAQLSSQSNSHVRTWPLEKPWPWLDGPSLVK